MNDVIDLMLAHRSIRTYTDEVVPDVDIKAAVAAGQKASTSSNIQTYSLVHITDSAKREAFIEISGGQEKVRDCGAFFVVCGDMRRHRLLAERCGSNCEENVESFLLSVYIRLSITHGEVIYQVASVQIVEAVNEYIAAFGE